jgi:TolB-like protein
VSFFNELKRRNVFRVGVAYIVVAWLLAQVADLAFENFGTPDWAIKTLLFVLVLGFPLALLFAWAFEMTPEGLKKEKDVDRSQSITQHTGRKLDYTIIAMLAVGLVYFAWESRFKEDSSAVSEADVPAGTSAVETTGESTAQPDKSIAVLPFVNMSSDAEQEYFSDGISEEILNALAKIQDLKVAGRTSSFSFKGKNEDLRIIGEALNVAHILEGSVRKSGDKIRVTAQLIKVDDGYHMWSETYDRELTDIFAIQDEISAAILEQMKLHLIGGESPTQLASARADVEAYNLYLAAKQNIYKRDKVSLELATSLLDRAIAIDPGYAPAHAQRGIVTLLLSEEEYGDIPENEVGDLAKPHFDRALELDSGLVEGIAGLGLYHDMVLEDSEAAIGLLEKALAINPNLINAQNWLQNALGATGRFNESLTIVEQILERDPLYRPAIVNASGAYFRSGSFEKLRTLLERIKIYMPGDMVTKRIEIAYENQLGNYAKSTQLAEQLWLETQERGENVRDAAFLFGLQLLNTAQWERLVQVGAPWQRIRALNELGRKEEAMLIIREQVEEDQQLGFLLDNFMVERQYQQMVEFVESNWEDLDAFEADQSAANGFGSGGLLDLAYAYREIGNTDKYTEIMVRARNSLQLQKEKGANNFLLELSFIRLALFEGRENDALNHYYNAHSLGFYPLDRGTERFPELAALDGNPRYERLLQDSLQHVNSERAKLELGPLEMESYL